MAADLSCPVCGAPMEDVLHVLRDCSATRQVWSRLFPMESVQFLSLSSKDWLGWNLAGSTSTLSQVADWSQEFELTCWNIWKSRNGIVFRNETIPISDKLRHLEKSVEEVASAWVKLQDLKTTNQF